MKAFIHILIRTFEERKASGESVREILDAESIDFTGGAREETRTPTDCSTGS